MAEFVEVMKQRARMCESIRCADDDGTARCELYKLKKEHDLIDCTRVLFLYPQEFEKNVMDWAKEHPMMTNADKFKEVFGFEPKRVCIYPKRNGFCNKPNCDYCIRDDFWNEEWKEPKETNNDRSKSK